MRVHNSAKVTLKERETGSGFGKRFVNLDNGELRFNAIKEAEQVVSKLKQRGVPVQYVLFPDEGHGWPARSSRME